MKTRLYKKWLICSACEALKALGQIEDRVRLEWLAD